MQHINKTKLRKINVLNELYLWKRVHFHLEEYHYSECVEVVIIYLNNHKNSPLKLFFRQEDNPILNQTSKDIYWCVGYPDDGVIWKYNNLNPQKENTQINLNRPAVIAKLIRHFVNEALWTPKETNKPHIVNDALKLLEIIDFPNGIN